MNWVLFLLIVQGRSWLNVHFKRTSFDARIVYEFRFRKMVSCEIWNADILPQINFFCRWQNFFWSEQKVIWQDRTKLKRAFVCFSKIAAEIKFQKPSKKLDRFFGEHFIFDEDQQVIVNSQECNQLVLICSRWSLENNVKDDMIIMENLIPKVMLTIIS